MILDKFKNPIFSSADVFDILYSDNISALSTITVESSPEIEKLENTAGIQLSKSTPVNLSIDDFDKTQQSAFFMPSEYYSFDIKQFCISKCTTQDEILRVLEELDAFKNHNMMGILQWLKYFVDTCTEQNVYWGVGRGSSVASFVLYLLGVHKINSIKYKLDWREFLR